MVEEGFLTPAQLEYAIAEQHRSNKPIGQVLVELGLVSAGAVANALAEQHGGLLKSEFGISAGINPVEAAEPVVAPEPAPAPARAPALPDPEFVSVAHPEELENRRLIGELDALRDQCRAISRAVALLESELERVRESV